LGLTRATVDLHVHTTASDGNLSPAEVVRAAKAAGLEAIAITDHDTVAGLAEALDAGRREGLDVLTGVELSADLPGSTMHILGYEIDPTDPALLDALSRIRRDRDERNPRILARLAEMGMPLEAEAVRAKARGETVGRPHIAQCMVDAGYVRACDEAFLRYLARGAPAYVERRRVSPEEAVQLIRVGGGLAALAHPKQIQRPAAEVRALAARLAEGGLEGIEVYHPDHSAADSATYRVLARDLGLVVTGGTDFHGRVHQGVRLGVGRGNLRVPCEAVREIRDRLARRVR